VVCGMFLFKHRQTLRSTWKAIAGANPQATCQLPDPADPAVACRRLSAPGMALSVARD
jgi:hypothetical protein